MASENEIKRMKENISRLTAALEEVNFECQRLEILNSNLTLQLNEKEDELTRNIALLQELEDENARLKNKLSETNTEDKA